MTRSKRPQSQHDAEVARIAKRYEQQGFNVKADTPAPRNRTRSEAIDPTL